MAFHPVKFHNIDTPGKTEDAEAADVVSSPENCGQGAAWPHRITGKIDFPSSRPAGGLAEQGRRETLYSAFPQENAFQRRRISVIIVSRRFFAFKSRLCYEKSNIHLSVPPDGPGFLFRLQRFHASRSAGHISEKDMLHGTLY